MGFCRSCGFIYNLAFDPNVLEYSSRYEATQSYSSSFNAFHRGLAEQLIERYDLRNKDVIEIGCGQGEFLSLLCEIGGNRGVGFDPVYNDERVEQQANGSIIFIKDFYSEKYAHFHADFVCCKMTLEHIQDTAKFVGMIGRVLEDKSNVTVFFQVPDVVRILREMAFWDIYYEHCSYFSLGSLARLFRKNGFDVINLERAYDDQYLMITVKPGTGMNALLEKENDLSGLNRYIARFVDEHDHKLDEWRKKLTDIRKNGKRIVIWGASSKAVAFLTNLKVSDDIQYAVDINPHKTGTYIAGTGQEIVAPEFMVDYRPDVAIVMNPIYIEEIKGIIKGMGVNTELISI